MKRSIVLAAGCFWGTQEYFRRLKGVTDTRVGYAQGHTENPTYAEVRSEITGHTEACRIVYEDTVITLNELVEAFFSVIDPTSLNRQGEDVGTNYRTGIYPQTQEELIQIQALIQKKQREYERPIVVEAELLHCFYDAEEFHQDYLRKNPNGYCHIDLKRVK